MNTDQVNIQLWSTTVSHNTTFTLQIELSAGLANVNALGIYNGSGGVNPPLYPVFPGSATAGWFAVASFFPSGNLVVNLFDENAVLQSSTAYTGVDAENFGFYLQNPVSGTLYSEDIRNGGNPQALVYGGSGTSAGQWWLCWEDLQFVQADKDFDDAVLFLESVNPPLAAQSTTWGGIKILYGNNR